MQRVLALAKTATKIGTTQFLGTAGIVSKCFSTIQNVASTPKLLSPYIPSISQVCTMKVKQKVRRRCKDCYFVVRDQRWYIMCHKFGRHKQMSMVKKPHNTWILTHASQSPIRPW